MTWLGDAARLRRQRVPAVLITQIGVRGHAPREAGAKMIATADGEFGTIGGGNLELTAIDRARAVVERGYAWYPVEMTSPGWGDRLYCVFAEQHATEIGQTAAAGIGWVLRDDHSGAGLFVEHEAPTEAEVIDLIEKSLADMTRSRGGRYTPVTMHTTEATCTGDPTCALVLAAYKSASWNDGMAL